MNSYSLEFFSTFSQFIKNKSGKSSLKSFKFISLIVDQTQGRNKEA
jgi:hypothetical protein